jgi:hypothetical protein
MSVPESIIGWEMEVGDNSDTKILNIKSNDNWTVNIKDNRTEHVGYLTEYDGANYLTRALNNPLAIACDGNAISALTVDDQLLADGIAADQGDDNYGQDFDVTFSQIVEYMDARLTAADGTVYHLVITFTAANVV